MSQEERRSNNAKEDRVRRLYRRQLEGLSARALVYDHVDKENRKITGAREPTGTPGRPMVAPAGGHGEGRTLAEVVADSNIKVRD